MHDLNTEPFMGNLWRGQLGSWWHAHRPTTFQALMGEADGSRHWALCAPWSDAEWVPAGAVLESRVTLIGPAVDHLEAVADGMEALGHQGLGARQGPVGHRARARLIDLRMECLPGSNATVPNLLDVLEQAAAEAQTPSGSLKSAPDNEGLHVALLRPLRFKVEGAVFVGAPSMEQLVRRILGRLVQLLPDDRAGEDPFVTPRAVPESQPTQDDQRQARLFAPQEHAAWIAAARSCICTERDMHRWRWERHSRRSLRVMPLEGITGRFHYRGPRAVLLPWMRLAEWTQIGSKTTFGFGALEVR